MSDTKKCQRKIKATQKARRTYIVAAGFLCVSVTSNTDYYTLYPYKGFIGVYTYVRAYKSFILYIYIENMLHCYTIKKNGDNARKREVLQENQCNNFCNRTVTRYIWFVTFQKFVTTLLHGSLQGDFLDFCTDLKVVQVLSHVPVLVFKQINRAGQLKAEGVGLVLNKYGMELVTADFGLPVFSAETFLVVFTGHRFNGFNKFEHGLFSFLFCGSFACKSVV